MEQLIQQLDFGDDESYNFSTFFKPIKVIGQGAFGKVIQAIDNSTNEELAIKVIHKKKMGDDFIEKVKQEARILEKLNHPNVVEFKRVCETETKILIAMELVKGGSLAQLMKDKKSQKLWFKEKEISQLMKSIMLGLAYIHGKNIVHRDLKPENILISNVNDFSTVKIADFGLSSAFSLWTTNGLTEQCGTLLYMAPEFFASRVYSKQIDIWSCGITMHNLLDHGNHPFYDPKIDDTESFKQKLTNPKWKVPSLFSDLAKNLLQKLSLINPTERYSAVQVLQHPFITENQNGVIPMTMNEQLLCFKVKECLSQKLKALVFIQYIKSLQSGILNEKEQEEINKQIHSGNILQQQDSTFSNQQSDCSIEGGQDNVRLSLQTEPSRNEETFTNRGKLRNSHNHALYLHHNQINNSNTNTNNHHNEIQNNNSSYNGDSFLQTQNNNNNNNTSIRKPPLNFMIKKQKSLNEQQQLPNNIQKKRNSVLNPRQDFTDCSILIEIQENPLDQQGSYSEKTFKRQSIINQVSQQNPQSQQQINSNGISQKNSPIIAQISPGKNLLALQLNRPLTNNNQGNHKRKVNIHPTPPMSSGQYSINKDSPLEYLETVNTPYNKDSDLSTANNPKSLLNQMRIKSATRLKQDQITNTKRRNSNLNQISHLQIIKKAIESQENPTSNINILQDVTIMSPKQNTPISPNYQKENRNCVSSLQTQNNSAKKPPLKQFQTQDCSEIAKQYLQQQQNQKNRHPQFSNQVYPRNKIPLRSSEVIYKKQSKSLSREEDKKNIQNQGNMYGLPHLSQKEKQIKILTQQTHEILDQEKDAVQRGIIKGYLMNTKSRQNHLISKRLQI